MPNQTLRHDSNTHPSHDLRLKGRSASIVKTKPDLEVSNQSTCATQHVPWGSILKKWAVLFCCQRSCLLDAGKICSTNCPWRTRAGGMSPPPSHKSQPMHIALIALPASIKLFLIGWGPGGGTTPPRPFHLFMNPIHPVCTETLTPLLTKKTYIWFYGALVIRGCKLWGSFARLGKRKEVMANS